MVDLAVIGMLAITLGLILLGLGLSLLSQGLKPLEYNQQWGDFNAAEYYDNPLYRLRSKYFYYRPKGSVILSRKQWDEIEKNMAIKLAEAKENGKVLGRKAAIIEIKDLVREEKTKVFPNSPYAVLDIKSTAPQEELRLKYQHLIKIYDPKNFVGLDKAFTELAEIRTSQITKAWKKINFSLGRSKGDI